MRSLFLIFHRLAPHNGISNKIICQLNAFRELGMEMNLCYHSFENSVHSRYVDEKIIKYYGKGLLAKILKRTEYTSVVNYVKREKIRYIYARYDHNANPFTVSLFKKLKRLGVRIDLEIPTYPYDSEYREQGLKFRAELFADKLFRRRLAKYIDRIITFSDYSVIFGVKTLKISNGIDFLSVKVRKPERKNDYAINLIGVADIHFWHGYDRLVSGMVNYYSDHPSRRVIFHIVGGGCKRELEKIRKIAESGGITPYVIFYGPKSGEELDNLFDLADFGIASLGRHRSGITRIRTLKTREYAARGIPFTCSEQDDDFEGMPYVLKIPADESPADVSRIVEFCTSNNFYPDQIRSSIEQTLSWKNQMSRVTEIFNS